VDTHEELAAGQRFSELITTPPASQPVSHRADTYTVTAFSESEIIYGWPELRAINVLLASSGVLFIWRTVSLHFVTVLLPLVSSQPNRCVIFRLKEWLQYDFTFL